jgi:hypothetical protein
MCVQRFDDSLNSAIHINYRISLRSSSLPEPRDPLLKVLLFVYHLFRLQNSRGFVRPAAGSTRQINGGLSRGRNDVSCLRVS